MNKFLLVVLPIAFLSFFQTQSFGQGDLFGQNLSLFSLSPHTDHPEIFFANNGWVTSIKQRSGSMTFHTDSGAEPFRVFRLAAHMGLTIGNVGVGIGTQSPSSALTVYSDDSTDFLNSRIVAYDGHSTTELRTMLQLSNNGPVRFELDNWQSNETWAFQTNNGDGFLINRLGSGGNEFSIRKSGMVTMGPGGKLNFILDAAGNLHIDGTLTQSSDRDKKEEFTDIDANEILDKVNRLPITSWRYKDDQPGVRHIGPVAQDFYREFQIGKDDKTIATVDADGVAFVAIQALTQKLDEQIRRNETLTRTVDELTEAVAAKNRRVAGVESRLDELETIVRTSITR